MLGEILRKIGLIKEEPGIEAAIREDPLQERLYQMEQESKSPSLYEALPTPEEDQLFVYRSQCKDVEEVTGVYTIIATEYIDMFGTGPIDSRVGTAIQVEGDFSEKYVTVTTKTIKSGFLGCDVEEGSTFEALVKEKDGLVALTDPTAAPMYFQQYTINCAMPYDRKEETSVSEGE